MYFFKLAWFAAAAIFEFQSLNFYIFQLWFKLKRTSSADADLMNCVLSVSVVVAVALNYVQYATTTMN